MSVKYLLPLMFGAVMFLVGCQGSSSGSGSSSTNAGVCNYNAATGYSTNSVTGAICSTNSNQNCVVNQTTGMYVNQTTGLACNNTTVGSCAQVAQGYFINTTTGQICNSNQGLSGANPCAYYQQIYGVPYSPAYVNGTIMCVAAY